MPFFLGRLEAERATAHKPSDTPSIQQGRKLPLTAAEELPEIIMRRYERASRHSRFRFRVIQPSRPPSVFESKTMVVPPQWGDRFLERHRPDYAGR